MDPKGRQAVSMILVFRPQLADLMSKWIDAGESDEAIIPRILKWLKKRAPCVIDSEHREEAIGVLAIWREHLDGVNERIADARRNATTSPYWKSLQGMHNDKSRRNYHARCDVACRSGIRHTRSN